VIAEESTITFHTARDPVKIQVIWNMVSCELVYR